MFATIAEYFPSIVASYVWFFYLGIFLFVTHILLYGIGLDLSYFGLLLIYIGWAKPQLYTWFRGFLWFFILLDVFATFRGFRDMLMKDKNKDKPKKKVSKEEPIDDEEDMDE